MSVDALCTDLVVQIHGAVAGAVIDVASIQIVGAYFRGPKPPALERPGDVLRLLTAGPISEDSTVREFHLSTAFEQQFGKLIDGDRALVLLISGLRINVGLTWAHLRAATADLEPAIASWRAAR